MIALRPGRWRPPSSVRLSCLSLVIVLVTPLWLATHAFAQSTEADVYVAQAVLEYSDGKYDEALANLRKALETEPDHGEALYLTGIVLMAKDQPAQAAPFLEKARARSRTDPAIAFQLGLAYFAQQQYDRAQPLLEEAFRRQPTLDGLGYYVGFLRYRKKDYRGALDAFRAGRTSNADLQQLTKFYSGLALGVLGLPGQAAAEIDQAIRAAPASAFTGPAERLRDSMVAARQGQRRLSAEVRLGFFYDDNVAVIPNAGSSEPLVAALRRVTATSSGELFGLRADYAWLRTDQWEATIGYSFFTTYNNDLPSFNIMSHLGNVGATYRTAVANMPLLVGGQYAFDALFLDQDAAQDLAGRALWDLAHEVQRAQLLVGRDALGDKGHDRLGRAATAVLEHDEALRGLALIRHDGRNDGRVEHIRGQS